MPNKSVGPEGEDLVVDNVPLAIAPFSEAERRAAIDALCADLLAALAALPQTRRLRVGICGQPGSGKSVLAARLRRHFASEGLLPEAAMATLGQDAYHLPNRELDARRYEGVRYPRRAGQPLRRIKGAPESYDAAAFAADLERLAPQSALLSLPTYCRQAHEPRPAGVTIRPEVRLVWVEGNFLLLPEPPWERLRGSLEFVVWLEIAWETCREGLAARHARGGKSAAALLDHVESVDRVNAERAREGRGRADAVLELGTPADQARLASGYTRLPRQA